MTVRKVLRRGEIRWVVDIPYKDVEGRKRRYRRDATVQTSAAARAEDRRLLVELGSTGEIKRGQPVVPELANTNTWADAVTKFKAISLPLMKPSVRHSYGEILKSDSVFVGWAEQSLASINFKYISEWDAGLVRAGLSRGRRRCIHVVLRSVLRVAVEQGMLDERPKLPRLWQSPVTIVRVMTQQQVDALLGVSSSSARLAFSLSIYAGLRAGEVRGLRWIDVDLDAMTIVVRQSICNREVAPPKSGNARMVPLAEPLAALLRLIDKRTGLVALTAKGKPWGPTGLHQTFKRAAARAGITAFRHHDLRHYFVTSLFLTGAPAHVVQKLAGHSSLAVTQRYAHVIETDLRAAIRGLSAARGNGVETGEGSAPRHAS